MEDEDQSPLDLSQRLSDLKAKCGVIQDMHHKFEAWENNRKKKMELCMCITCDPDDEQGNFALTLRCPICLAYMLDALTVCQNMHTFCKDCVNKFLGESEVVQQFVCPLCQKFCPVGGIRANALMHVMIWNCHFNKVCDKNIVSEHSQIKMRSDGKCKCHACSPDQLTNTCSRCYIQQNEVPTNCSHLSLWANKNYQLVPAPKYPNRQVIKLLINCYKHAEAKTLHCIPCNICICVICDQQEHVFHKTEQIEEILCTYRSYIREATSVIRNNIQQTSENKNVLEIRKVLLSKQLESDEFSTNFSPLRREENERTVNEINRINQEIAEAGNYMKSASITCTWIEAIVIYTEGVGLLRELESGYITRLQQMTTEILFPKETPMTEMTLPFLTHGLYNSLKTATPAINLEKALKQARNSRVLPLKFDPNGRFKKVSSFEVKAEQSYRMCLFQDALWVPCMRTISAYSLQGDLQQTVTLSDPDIQVINSLCGFTSDSLVAATTDGLFEVDSCGLVLHKLRGGNFYDVHVDDNYMVAIRKRYNKTTSTIIRVLKIRGSPPTVKSVKTFDADYAVCLLLHKGTIYISEATLDTKVVRVIDLATGRPKCFRWKLSHVQLVSLIDSERRLILTGIFGNRFQLMKKGRVEIVAESFSTDNARDVAYVNDTFYVLGRNKIEMFKCDHE